MIHLWYTGLQFPSHTGNKVIYRALVTAVIALVPALGLWFAGQTNVAAPLGDYNTYQCETGTAGNASFRVLTLSSEGAIAMADRLCQLPAMRGQFNAVTITWQHRGFLTAQHIVDEEYDYFWNRQHLVAGMVPDFHNYYRPLFSTPVYSLYLISRHEQPQLTPAHMAGKTLGLLRDPQSQTFFLQPFKALKEAGISLQESQKRFYPDIASLYAAFRDGKVDMVTGTRQIFRDQGVDTYHSLLLADNVSSGAWFLRRRWFGSGLDCALIQAGVHSPMLEGVPSVTVESAANCEAAP